MPTIRWSHVFYWSACTYFLPLLSERLREGAKRGRRLSSPALSVLG